MIQSTDQLGRIVTFSEVPKRIISCVPSQTELLYDLGLDESVIGITKFCIHPSEWFRNKTRIGGTKNLDIAKIKSLKPDLIIANKEENTREQLEELMLEFPVWISDVKDLEEAGQLIIGLGNLLNRSNEAKQLHLAIITEFSRLQPVQNKSCVYFIWKNPYMCVGNSTFINHLLEKCGFINCFKNSGRYPQLSAIEIADAKPDLLFLSSEPFPFKTADIAHFEAICPNSKVILVNGEAFSWYGSRLLKSVDYFEELLKTI